MLVGHASAREEPWALVGGAGGAEGCVPEVPAQNAFKIPTRRAEEELTLATNAAMILKALRALHTRSR
jgi:hypothetical protein